MSSDTPEGSEAVARPAAAPMRAGGPGMAIAIGIYLLSRVLVSLVAWTAPQHREGRGAFPAWWSDVPLVRWDGGHYRYILEHGYPPEINDTVAFFPAYPLLCRPFAWFMPPDWALIVTSQLAGLIAVCFIYRWAQRHTSSRIALWSIILLLAYPPAFFLSTSYSDAVLLATVAVVLWLLDRDRVWLAALVSAVATAVRPTGLVVAAVVTLWALACGQGRPWALRLARAGAVGGISIAGLIAFELHLWHHYGRPDAFFAAQAGWKPTPVEDPVFRLLTFKPVLQPAFRPIKYLLRGPFRAIGGNWSDLRALLQPDTWNPFFNVALVVIGIIGFVRPGRIPRLAFLLPVLVFLEAYLADPFRAGRLVGIARYQLIAISSFVLLAHALRNLRVLRWTLVVAGLFLQMFYIRGFADWILVG